MGRLELVVARYREDLQWLRRVPTTFRIAVYNKGSEPDSLPARRELALRELPLVGREAFTYLHHIVDYYDELADVTVFAQGRPFDHVPDFHKILRQLANEEGPLDGFRWLGFIIDEDDRDGALVFQQWSKNLDGRPLDLDGFWRAIWNEPAPERVRFYPGAHFAVTAETIRKQPRSFYERALKVSAEYPDAGHAFERTWDRVFATNGIPPAYRTASVPIYLRRIRRVPESRYPDVPMDDSP